MRRRMLVCIGLGMLLLVMLPGQISYATPSPPEVLINESTRECYVSIMSDECMSCDPPPGWKVYSGPGDPGYGRTDCPAGFNEIVYLKLNCKGYKDRLCCGVFAAHGNCEDMVVNATQQACGFVDNINACTLPEGWSKRPTDVPPGIWGCNYNKDHWIGDVNCVAATQTPKVLSVREVATQTPGALPVTGFCLLIIGGGMMVWLARGMGGRRR